jgi:hypothetical protein
VGNPANVQSFKGLLSTLKFYQEYDQMDHASFTIGKNMGFLTDVVAQLKALTSVE